MIGRPSDRALDMFLLTDIAGEGDGPERPHGRDLPDGSLPGFLVVIGEDDACPLRWRNAERWTNQSPSTRR